MPKSIEIRCPILDSRLKLDLPNLGTLILSDYGLFDRDTVVQLCEKSLRTVREWEWLVQRRISEGLSLGLAWRMGAKLDWVWQLHDLHGRPRDWAVLYGIALNQVCFQRACSCPLYPDLPVDKNREGSLHTWRFGSKPTTPAGYT